MKPVLLALGVALSFTAALAADPGPSYRALSILDGKSVLCYGTVAVVNNVRDDTLGAQADTVLAAKLSDMKLSAKRYDGKCDRLLMFTFQVLSASAPTVYSDELKLVTYTVTDQKSGVPLSEASVWQAASYGGDTRIFGAQESTDRMNMNLKALLDRFETDYISNGWALE